MLRESHLILYKIPFIRFFQENVDVQMMRNYQSGIKPSTRLAIKDNNHLHNGHFYFLHNFLYYKLKNIVLFLNFRAFWGIYTTMKFSLSK